MPGLEEWTSIEETFFLDAPVVPPADVSAKPPVLPTALLLLPDKAREEPVAGSLSNLDVGLATAPVPLSNTERAPEAGSNLPRAETNGDQSDAPIPIGVEPRSNRVWIAIGAGIFAHLMLFCGLVWAAPWLFRIEAYPSIVRAGSPPPLEVALVPEAEPSPAPPSPAPEPPTPAVVPQVVAPLPPPPARVALPVPHLPPPRSTLIAPRARPALLDAPVRAAPRAQPVILPPTTPASAQQNAPPAPAMTPGMVDAGPSDYLDAPKLEYPPEALRTHESGRVILRVVVNSEGEADDVQVERSSGFRLLDESAREQVKARYRFKVGNSRVLLVPISFELNGE